MRGTFWLISDLKWASYLSPEVSQGISRNLGMQRGGRLEGRWNWIWILFIGLLVLPHKRPVCAALFPGLASGLHAHLFLVCNTQLCLFVIGASLANAGFAQCYSLGARNFFTLVFLVCSIQSCVVVFFCFQFANRCFLVTCAVNLKLCYHTRAVASFPFFLW